MSDYRWDWNVLFQEPYLGWFATGLQMTIIMGFAGFAIALLLGIPLGVMRTSSSAVPRWIARLYVDVFRNIPLLVQMFLWFHVVPELLPRDAGIWVKRLPNGELITAVICLGFAAAARISEHVRAAIGSVPAGLRNASIASGMTAVQLNQYIVLPIALRRTFPTLISEFLAVFKNSSIAMTIGVLEITAQSRRVLDYTFHGFEAFTAATVLYATICLATLAIAIPLERRLAIAGQLSAKA